MITVCHVFDREKPAYPISLTMSATWSIEDGLEVVSFGRTDGKRLSPQMTTSEYKTLFDMCWQKVFETPPETPEIDFTFFNFDRAGANNPVTL